MQNETESPFIQWDPLQANEIIEANKTRPGALMPILTDLLDTFGYIDPSIVPDIATALNLSRAEIHGVISFYHDFRTSPPGHHVIKVCRAEACQSMQGHELIEKIKSHLGVDFHETTTDRKYTLEPVYCLGNCACAPAVMMDDELHGRMNLDKFKKLISGDAK